MQGVEQSFERLVATIQGASTLRCAQRLLRRLAEKLALRSSDVMSDVSGLMRRLYPRTPQNVERYPSRVFLCSYMMLSHPEVRPVRNLTMSPKASAGVVTNEGTSSAGLSSLLLDGPI
jgi:hypothetical protein